MGPRTSANAMTTETAAAAFGIFSGEISSNTMIMDEENTPAAPIPLSARKIILQPLISALAQFLHKMFLLTVGLSFALLRKRRPIL